MNNTNYFDWKEAKSKFDWLSGVWSTIESETEDRRKLRYADIDVEEERSKGNLGPDERYIPIRVADTNIRRECGSYINYVTQSRRQVIFEAIESDTLVVDDLELDFTKRCRYSGWQIPIFRGIDSCVMHAWCHFEVVYDRNKPGFFEIQYVPFTDLAFPEDTEDLQACEFIMRFYRMSPLEMRTRDDFDQAQVEKILGNTKNNDDKQSPKLQKVFKAFFKNEGTVYVGWGSKDCDGWLKEPIPLYLGIDIYQRDPETGQVDTSNPKQTYMDQYPVFRLPYLVSENPRIMDLKGRVFLDGPVQESASSLNTSLVVGFRRSSNMYFCRDTDGNWGSDSVQTDLKLVPGAEIPYRVKFQTLPAPPVQMLSAIQQLLTQNQQETNMPNFAVLNRKDSEKTATEIQAAQSASSMLGSVQVALFSVTLRDIYTLCWRIYKTHVIGGIIKSPVAMEKFTDYTYNLKPAGDQDVIERAEKINKFMMFWPVVSQTPLAKPWIKLMVEMAFPAESRGLLQEMEQAKTELALIKFLRSVLMTVAFDPQTGEPVPAIQPFLPQLQQINEQIDLLTGEAAQPTAGAPNNRAAGQPNAPGLASPSLYNPSAGQTPERNAVTPPLG